MKTISLANKCYVILPALNEATSIKSTIDSIIKIIPKSNVIVVDKGSTDETLRIVNSLGINIYKEPKVGKGFAVRRGFNNIPKDAEAIFLVDADDTYSVDSLKMGIDLVINQNVDMVVGTRILSSNSTDNRKPVFKKGHSLGNLILSFLSNALYPVGIEDALSGWRIFSPAFIRSFPGGATGFEIEAELNAHAYLLQVQVRNIPVEYQGREFQSNSKLRTYSDGFKILRMNLRIFRNDRPQLAFSLISAPWVLISFAFIGRAVNGYLETGLVPQFPSLIVGIGAFITFGLLWVTGMILQRIKLIRSNLAQFAYKGFK